MIKKVLVTGLVILAIIASLLFFMQYVESHSDTLDVKIKEISTTITMPTKSSRPGCDETDSCYIPSKISIKVGESVTWINEDAAFHSVTSGNYNDPNTLFDSGHLEPNKSFTIKFEESGIYDYFCTLHPWMKGKVVVE
jgi:amicyanin